MDIYVFIGIEMRNENVKPNVQCPMSNVFLGIEMRNENVKPNVQCPDVQCIYMH